MKRALFALALVLLFSSGAFAQRFSSPRQSALDTAPNRIPLEKLIDARAKLIQRYAGTFVWGVSVCGSDGSYDNDELAWLTVYVYSDSLAAFTEDFNKFMDSPGATVPTVGGVPVTILMVERPKRGAANEQPNPGTPDVGKYQNRRSHVQGARNGA